MLQFTSLTVGPFASNCYLVWEEPSREALIIDPGGDRDDITAAVEARSLRPKRILLTHGHPDHCFHAGDLAGHYGASIAMHTLDVGLLTDSLPIAELYYDLSTYVPFVPDELLEDGEVIRLDESQIRVLHTPGHSRGGLCFKTEAGVFCGDTIFAGSIGRTDFPGGSHQQLIESIRTKLLVLPDDTPLRPGHGPSTTVGVERTTNPYVL